jgi:hypothetical protein
MYSPALRQVFALRQYSDHINVYSPTCTALKTVKPASPLLRSIIIHDFFYSETQQRLAASFKDSWLCFWDAADNFNYEKIF